MLLLAAVAASLVTLSSAVADEVEPSASPTPAAQVRYVGENLSYSLNAVMSQSISGFDAFGRRINQTLPQTTLKLHENIAITQTPPPDITTHRNGTITAVVAGAKPVKKDGQGWTSVDNRGLIVRDAGKLGGLFLLPLPFLAGAALKEGGELAVGDTWSGLLGTKLYGMTAHPRLKFTVTAERLVNGVKVYSIDAAGTVPMKQPVMTTSGEPLGYAKGTADISAHIEYDRTNRRLVSMHALLSDTLHYAGPTKHASGRVKDREQADVVLDSTSASAAGQRPSDNSSAGPQP